MKKKDEKALDKELAELSGELKEKERGVVSVIRDGANKWKAYMDTLTDICERWLHHRDIWATALMLIAENVGTEFEVENRHTGHFNVNVHVYPIEDTGKWRIKIDVVTVEEEDKDD